ncbi:MAG: hypothetical protein Q9225_007414 [Loekoesia sp. 1 TL-2023]
MLGDGGYGDGGVELGRNESLGPGVEGAVVWGGTVIDTAGLSSPWVNESGLVDSWVNEASFDPGPEYFSSPYTTAYSESPVAPTPTSGNGFKESGLGENYPTAGWVERLTLNNHQGLDPEYFPPQCTKTLSGSPLAPTPTSTAAARALQSIQWAGYETLQHQESSSRCDTQPASIPNRKRPASQISQDNPPSSTPRAYKRRRREIKTIRRGTSLAEAIARLDPWYWDVADVDFALTDPTSIDVILHPPLAALSPKLQDLVLSHDISGRHLLTCIDTLTLQQLGMSSAQQTILLHTISSLRQRSSEYFAYNQVPRPSSDDGGGMPRDRARILRDLRSEPLEGGEERVFETPRRRYFARKDGGGVYQFWYSSRGGGGEGGGFGTLGACVGG